MNLSACATYTLLYALFVTFLIRAEPSKASPWIDVGDERTRHHLQTLKDTGLIDLQLTTWPLPWADVSQELSQLQLKDMSEIQLWSYRYLKHALERAQKPAKSTKHIFGSNSLIPFTHFASDSREKAFTGTTTTFTGHHAAFNIALQAIYDPIDGKKYRADGSYVAATLGNWIFGIDAVDRWWGPGWQSSLILSNNARPTPGVFLKRKESTASALPVLSWLGEWSLDVFAHQLEGGREIPEAKLIGARLTLSPTERVELGMSRTGLWGGEGRIENTQSLVDFLGRRDVLIESEQKNGSLNLYDESNQLLSLDIRVNATKAPFPITVYGQVITNQRQGHENAETGHLLGLEASFAWVGTHTRLGIEISDTRNSNDGILINDLYEHQSYLTGYRHRSRNIGESAGTNALKYALFGDHYFANGRHASWRLVQTALNGNEISSNNMYDDEMVTQRQAEVLYKIPLSNSIMSSFGIFLLDKDMMLTSEKISSGGFLHLEIRF